MKILWTKNKLPASVGIRWMLEEDSSHIVFVFDDKLAIHSNFMGFQIAWASTIRKHNTVVHELDFPMTLEQEEAVYQSLMNKFDDYGYDWKSFLYFTWRGILKKFLNKPIPTHSPYNGKGFLCVEVAKEIPWSRINPKLGFINLLSLSITSPTKLHKYMIKSLS